MLWILMIDRGPPSLPNPVQPPLRLRQCWLGRLRISHPFARPINDIDSPISDSSTRVNRKFPLDVLLGQNCFPGDIPSQ